MGSILCLSVPGALLSPPHLALPCPASPLQPTLLGLSSRCRYPSILRTHTRDGFWTAFCDKRCWPVTRQGILSLASSSLQSCPVPCSLHYLSTEYSVRVQTCQLLVVFVLSPFYVYVVCRLLCQIHW
ncbi:uncharacterized protein BDZ83DRAFT_213404 [Colletotrichum acutatum]|uniref:Uncharacterized protein n=1 Tax=Glomerella acutata TaxID=27357 RepID=A0AAD8UU46_GLOAC|nr:uncharacterized protein BDZ83DRAFT_213404 [Colletotrichum acutatum]KAK1727361.1 hypothetical protein BDZ83DRAFT_213404 [Colletotrichum acutatum]